MTKNVSNPASKKEARKTDLIMYTQIRPHFIMWDKMLSCGATVIIIFSWKARRNNFNVIIWCCFMVSSCGMITHTPFHYCIKAYHCVCSQLRPKFLPVVIAGIWKSFLILNKCLALFRRSDNSPHSSEQFLIFLQTNKTKK